MPALRSLASGIRYRAPRSSASLLQAILATPALLFEINEYLYRLPGEDETYWIRSPDTSPTQQLSGTFH